MGEFNWQQTAAQAAKGDKDAFELLYKQTERSVYFTCLKLLGNEHDAKDIMQDTYITAFEKLSELSDYSNIPGWINRIAINRCKMLFRKQKPDYIDDVHEQAKEIIDESEIIPSDYVSDAEKRHIIMNIIDTQLSDLQRQTVILYYYDEMSVAQIAEIMECPEGTVKYRLSAAREKIREAILIYEKENDDRLHAIMPIPVLTSILRKEAEEIAVPKIQLFKPQVASPKHGTGNNSKLHMKGQNAMTNAIKGKIIAGVAATVIVVGGGIAAGVALSNRDSGKIEADSSGAIVDTNTDANARSDDEGNGSDNIKVIATSLQRDEDTPDWKAFADFGMDTEIVNNEFATISLKEFAIEKAYANCEQERVVVNDTGYRQYVWNEGDGVQPVLYLEVTSPEAIRFGLSDFKINGQEVDEGDYTGLGDSKKQYYEKKNSPQVYGFLISPAQDIEFTDYETLSFTLTFYDFGKGREELYKESFEVNLLDEFNKHIPAEVIEPIPKPRAPVEMTDEEWLAADFESDFYFEDLGYTWYDKNTGKYYTNADSGVHTSILKKYGK